ncbi:putative transposase [Magnetofaba australis IT-1]|uniref:Putative transposase n=1 Tax=Magnetofaba australis IT-1 TaxID=1434232 RepID=A0A1Y2K725_9PROT|nr:putative transposase [Magnetofaba australis IT-1]
MSAKGNCYDNACAESFFHSLLVEAIHRERFHTREQMRQTVFEYIEMDYHRVRRMAPTAISAQQRLRLNKSLNDVSNLGGQDQLGLCPKPL